MRRVAALSLGDAHAALKRDLGLGPSRRYPDRSAMKIRTLYQGKHTIFDRPGTAVVVGRPKSGTRVDVDLTPDDLASRQHAKISFEDGRWWIEDLGSSRGTKVDGREIKGLGRTPLSTSHTVRIGATVLRLDSDDAPTISAELPEDSSETWKGDQELFGANAIYEPAPPRPEPVRFSSLRAQRAAPGGDALTISLVLPAVEPLSPGPAIGGGVKSNPRQQLLYDLLLGFNVEAPLDQVLQHALNGLVGAIEAAERGAVLVMQPATKNLLLKAHLPPGQPSVSETLAQRAMQRGEGFIWQDEQCTSVSQLDCQIASGMYAPMVWKGETFGVICVDNSTSAQSFEQEDLRLLVAAAQHAALAIANHQLRDELQCNLAVIERLSTSFSPKIRRRLLDKARHGRLRLGGEKSEVTILSSDIRGFTRLTAHMDAEDVVDMLNSYFSSLVEAVFRHDGTIDKFIGDAILAVFGSPEPDPDHHANAVRAALAMQAALADVNARRNAQNQVICEMGIGVHSGAVLHGFIGSEERMEFTVIGDTVNRAARYCDGAAAGQVLISPEVHQRVWKMVRTKPVSIPTKHEGEFHAFQVLELKAPPATGATS
jgi:adenylate cyclase